jgi:hypothetical protein
MARKSNVTEAQKRFDETFSDIQHEACHTVGLAKALDDHLHEHRGDDEIGMSLSHMLVKQIVAINEAIDALEGHKMALERAEGEDEPPNPPACKYPASVRPLRRPEGKGASPKEAV